MNPILSVRRTISYNLEGNFFACLVRFWQYWAQSMFDFTLVLCNIFSANIDKILCMYTKILFILEGSYDSQEDAMKKKKKKKKH